MSRWLDCDGKRIVSRWLFLRLLGGIYLIAFLSLGTQVVGLIGHNGILPVDHLLPVAHQQLGAEGYWLLPTLCWLNTSDAFLKGLCAAGSILSVWLIVDVAPALVLFLLWAIYLSLVTVGRDFLAFQWDSLLLETGFLAIFLAPLRLWHRPIPDPPPSTSVVWWLRWLLFRLMFSSGVVKLASGDATWRHATALTYHYETQPLPTWISWYAHQLPGWFHHFSCLVMFGIELVVPLLIFGSRRYRSVACALLITFQSLIIGTGNYCFFNLLTIALCLLLLDDAAWPQWLRDALDRGDDAASSSRRWSPWMLAPLTLVILMLTVGQWVSLSVRRSSWMAPLVSVERWLEPFRSINSYGLFAVMTTSRAEIIVEGSQDGSTWWTYEFKYKPGNLSRRPRFVAPHQPRLDWQMWFAALGRYQDNPWFLEFCGRVLTGSRDVLALLAENPFPDGPPRYLRAVVYEYHFTDVATRLTTGAWWRRDVKRLYGPVLSLRQE